MTFVITQRCCNDTSCVAVCPVDCIRPRPGDPGYTTAEMLYIDPDTCIDCGACVDACPVDAIYSEYDLDESMSRYTEINAAYFEQNPLDTDDVAFPTPPKRPSADLPRIRVAIVGSGPAACYCAAELLARGSVEVEMFDRLPSPWGLVRSGVAPDHQETKGVVSVFGSSFKSESFQFYLDVEVGKHISHDELLRHHDAVIYAVGAATDRKLGIPGESLPGSHSATEFVSWYNGHPDFSDREFDLSGERAVIVGNGNVALDVARVLTCDVDELARTDIADHTLDALRNSNIREVVVLGRRGPLQAAYSAPEFLALGHLNGVDVVIDQQDVVLDAASAAALDDPGALLSDKLKVDLAREYAQKPADGGNKRIVFRYLVAPTELQGTDRVESVTLVHNILDDDLAASATEKVERLEASLVLRSVGYRGEPVADVPFDEARGIIPNHQGRVDGAVGVYTSGWIKRGPRGVIGTNRVDAKETVAQLLADFDAGLLTAPELDRTSLVELVTERQPDMIDKAGWAARDAQEKAAGKAAGRPRIKITARTVSR
ncbi:FAD-dependent oxidoreductase [Rhodococcus globerulus]|uniref:FAD-dependent oxidoreductase n=1 Tax=Rhodococcus globerulus TaxID=33008 RepID=UPI0030158E7A